jgi:hypothetical protein
MIKYILVGLTALFLVSCTQVNTSTDKTITQDGDTVAEVDISLSKMDAVEELSKIDEPQAYQILFKASGSEPGWFAEISAFKIRVVLDYGKDSVILENQGEVINDKVDYKYVVPNTISIDAVNKPCIAAGSGDKMDRQVTIAYKGKKYTGCGSFVK